MGEGSPYDIKRIKHLLSNPQEIIEDPEESLIEFSKLLAKLPSQDLVNPQRFLITAAQILDDLERGVDGWTGEKITHFLTGQPSLMYHLLFSDLPEIVRRIYPKDFVNEFMEIYNSVKLKWLK